MLQAILATGTRRITALNILCQEMSPEVQTIRVADSLREAEAAASDLRGLFLAEFQGFPVGTLLMRMQPHGIAFLWPPVISVNAFEVIAQHSTALTAFTCEAIEDVLLKAATQQLIDLKAKVSQSLLEQNQTRERLALARNGFHRLTDLIFFEYPTAHYQNHSEQFSDVSAASVSHVVYRRSRNQLRFAQVIEQTYRNSLDCPELNGIRTASESLSDYAASGTTVRELWRVYNDGHADVGVILVVDRPDQRAWEVIYLGVVETSRRRGIARTMLKNAIEVASEAGIERLIVVADSRNLPAISLYQSFGFKPFDERTAYVRFENRS